MTDFLCRSLTLTARPKLLHLQGSKTVVHASMHTLPGVWVAAEHQCSLWCNQLTSELAKTLVDLAIHDRTGGRLAIGYGGLRDKRSACKNNGTVEVAGWVPKSSPALLKDRKASFLLQLFSSPLSPPSDSNRDQGRQKIAAQSADRVKSRWAVRTSQFGAPAGRLQVAACQQGRSGDEFGAPGDATDSTLWEDMSGVQTVQLEADRFVLAKLLSVLARARAFEVSSPQIDEMFRPEYLLHYSSPAVSHAPLSCKQSARCVTFGSGRCACPHAQGDGAMLECAGIFGGACQPMLPVCMSL